MSDRIITIFKASAFFIGVFLLCFFSASAAHAAVVGLAVESDTVAQNQVMYVNVSLDTEGTSTNAIQAEITFPSALFTLQKINDGSSAVSLWIDPPTESAPGVIDLAGIMPGGFTGSDGPLFSFELQPLATGTGTIQVASATVLANDGLGSPVSVSLGNVPVSVGAASTSSPDFSAPSPDYTAPNLFTPQIVSNPNIFNGKYFLVFAATDNASGIDHYEVLEVPSGASEQPFSSWHEATSPYLLTDQSLSSDIYVRAVDHDGNFIVVKVPAEHPRTRWSDAEWLIGSVSAIALVLLLLIWVRRRRGHIL